MSVMELESMLVEETAVEWAELWAVGLGEGWAWKWVSEWEVVWDLGLGEWLVQVSELALGEM